MAPCSEAVGWGLQASAMARSTTAPPATKEGARAGAVPRAVAARGQHPWCCSRRLRGVGDQRPAERSGRPDEESDALARILCHAGDARHVGVRVQPNQWGHDGEPNQLADCVRCPVTGRQIHTASFLVTMGPRTSSAGCRSLSSSRGCDNRRRVHDQGATEHRELDGMCSIAESSERIRLVEFRGRHRAR